MLNVFSLWVHDFTMSCSTVNIFVFPVLFIVSFSQLFELSLLVAAGTGHVCSNPDASFSIGASFCCDSPPPPRPFLFLARRPPRPMLCPQGDAGCHKAAREATSHHVMLITAIIILVIAITIVVIMVII